MSNMTMVESLGWLEYHDSLDRFGAAYATASDVSIGTFSSTFTPLLNNDSAGILILLEAAT